MANAPHAAWTFYLSGLLVMTAAIHIGATTARPPIGPLQRGLSQGEIRSGVPRLQPADAMANAAVLMAELDDVPHPGLGKEKEGSCRAPARTIALLLSGRLSRVRFSARSVCQLRRLKEISAAQQADSTFLSPQETEAAQGDLGEVAAFILGRRLADGSDVDVTRIIVPPFTFSRDALTFVPADLGPLQKNEQLIGTYHTHPGDDLSQGVLSDIDLGYMHDGYVDFHGQVGALAQPKPELDWLFDIVDPINGAWNVYAHDAARLRELQHRCESEPVCPVNELRLAGSPFYLLTRYYEEQDGDI